VLEHGDPIVNAGSPLSMTVAMWRSAVPEFVMVTNCWFAEPPGPTWTLPNDTDDGLTAAAGWMPVTVRATDRGDPGASSLITSVPERDPTASGDA
jgi:hypothetical protein